MTDEAKTEATIETFQWSGLDRIRCSICGFSQADDEAGRVALQAHVDSTHVTPGPTTIPADYDPAPVDGTHDPGSTPPATPAAVDDDAKKKGAKT